MNSQQVVLVESLTGTPGQLAKKFRARIIEADRWGSTAYYPKDVLERDGSRVFTSGLAMYADHPTESESWERPERSIHDMVGKLTSDAVMESDGLYADVEFYDSFLQEINEKHEDVGLSVRATGLTEDAEMDGRFGPVLVGLLSADSVDVVTRAGAGGKLTSILESDRSPAGQPIDRKDTQSMTDVTKEDFDALRTELVEAISGIPAALKEALTPEPAATSVVPDASVETDAAKEEAAAKAAAEAEAAKPADVDHAAVIAAVTEAGLPADKAIITPIVSDVQAGVALTEAVKKQTDLRDKFLEGAEAGVFVRESARSSQSGLAYAVEKLNGK